ncbi:uncharacterized protein BXZ73DRAFT_49265 [Epithele typhae]|uniref:uncharacterized protein n=1 Tax=Epithele typhae TaxID=378194 RepID=UPI002007FA00|nr:uncharacterized protein BXZ73DRAFT_49265 [Epithele typhae]KAH9926658.1 hypothetical protein BXZ73DRAFT_49265 [Epithele typhae]
MAGLPPQINTTDTGTPAREWAQSTTTAAFAHTDPVPAAQNPATASNATQTQEQIKQPQVGDLSISAAANAQKGPFDAKLVPGAYPDTPGTEKPPIVASTTAPGSMGTTGTSASGFMQSAAAAAAGYLPRGVVDTVTSYMPTTGATATMSTARASEHDIEHKTSFPTSEMSGAGPHDHIAGVGALPGPRNEAGVAKLPDERDETELYMTAGAAAAALAGGAYALKEAVMGGTEQAKQTVQENGASFYLTVGCTRELVPPCNRPSLSPCPFNPPIRLMPGKAHSTAVTASSLPTHEPFGSHPGDHSLGVGALPGNQSEPHVARLPEESIHPAYDSGDIDSGARVAMKPSEENGGNENETGEAARFGGVGSLVGGANEEGVAMLPDERLQQTGSIPGTSMGKIAGATAGAGLTVAGASALKEQHDAKAAEKSVKPPAPTETQDKPSPMVTEEKTTASAAGVTAATAKGAHSSRQASAADARDTQPDTSKDATADHKSQPIQPERTVVGWDEAHTDLSHPTTRVRVHAIGDARVVWGDEPLDGDAARSDTEYDVDDDEHERRKGGGYDTGYHPAALHPRDEKYAPSSDETPDPTSSEPGERQRTQSLGKDSKDKGAKEKKASFMEKMKGEAKALIGKIEGRHDKVEAGQKMKTGEGKINPSATQQQPQEAVTQPGA